MRTHHVAAILAATALSGCIKDGVAPTADAGGTRMELRFVFMDRDRPLGHQRLFRDYVNTLCRLDELCFMLSGPVALNEYGMPLGNWERATITADLAASGTAQLLGTLEPGDVHFLDVRLGPADVSVPAANVLCDASGNAPQWSALWVKGVLDSDDDDLITEADEPFMIRCPLPAQQPSLRIHAHATIEPGKRNTLDLFVDVHALFHGIDIADEPDCTRPSPFNQQALTNLITRALGEAI